MSSLYKPTIIINNSNGEPIITMKQKGMYGKLYYLFDTNFDNVEKDRIGDLLIAWEKVKMFASEVGIPLISVKEVYEKVREFKNKQVECELKMSEDIDIMVLDHATNETLTLTIGLNYFRSR